MSGTYMFLGQTAATGSTALVEPVGDILKRMEAKRMHSFCNSCTAIGGCHLMGTAVDNCPRIIEHAILQEAERTPSTPIAEQVRKRVKPRFDFSRIEAKRKERINKCII